MIVAFDTNALLKDPTLTGVHAIAILEGETQLGYELLMPEVVMTEALSKRRERLRDVASQISRLRNQTASLNLGTQMSPPDDSEIEKALESYREQLENIFPAGSRIPLPSISQEDMLKRATQKIRPFLEGDKGFRDTLIWLSILVPTINKQR